DHIGPESREVQWFDTSTSSDDDGSFEFRNVPVGRYLLVSNPTGPNVTRLKKESLERTYYSDESNKAQILDVTFDGIRLAGGDVKVGRAANFRQVSVRVEFPDGEGMKTVAVQCVALPTESDQLPVEIYFGGSTDKTAGTFEFQVPADRKLEMEVKDSYL